MAKGIAEIEEQYEDELEAEKEPQQESMEAATRGRRATRGE
ncbi:hypothetical protein [Streptomyces sp. NPDC048411]